VSLRHFLLSAAFLQCNDAHWQSHEYDISYRRGNGKTAFPSGEEHSLPLSSFFYEYGIQISLENIEKPSERSERMIKEKQGEL